MDKLTPLPFHAALALLAKGATERPHGIHPDLGPVGLPYVGERTGLTIRSSWSSGVGTVFSPGSPEVEALLPYLGAIPTRGIHRIPVEGGSILPLELRRYRNADPTILWVIPAMELVTHA